MPNLRRTPAALLLFRASSLVAQQQIIRTHAPRYSVLMSAARLPVHFRDGSPREGETTLRNRKSPSGLVHGPCTFVHEACERERPRAPLTCPRPSRQARRWSPGSPPSRG